MIIQIKDKLIHNEDLIRNILERLECTKIHKVDEAFRFGRDFESSGTANVLNIHTLAYKSFSHNKSGDILTLVSDIRGMSLGDSVRWLANILNIKGYSKQQEIELPFGGFFKKYLSVKEVDDTPPLTYAESELEAYERCVSMLWIKDGIGALTQMKFGIGYSHDMYGHDRITIPIRDELGQLCGVIGRLNKDNVDSNEAKYLSLIPVNRSKVLFGFYENYNDIVEAREMLIVESEKSVMKGFELKNKKNCVAVGKHSISPRQAKLIKSTFCNRVIIAFDEDVPLEECMAEAEKIRMQNPFHLTEIYIVNMDNPYVEKGSKVSLLDLKEEVIDAILENHLIRVV